VQTCVVANFRDEQLEYYDSLGSADALTIESMLRWVREDFADKYAGEPLGKYDVRCLPTAPCLQVAPGSAPAVCPDGRCRLAIAAHPVGGLRGIRSCEEQH
jgi:hypothetical protein